MNSITTNVGIDVSKDTLDVHVDRPDGQKRFQFRNSLRGVAQLKKVLGRGEYLIALEATGRYESLARHELEAAGYSVLVQNPRHVRRLAQGMGIQAKTDGIDAKVLARTAKLCAKNQPRSMERENLGDLSRSIETLKKERSAHKKRLGVPGLSKVVAGSLRRIIKALDKEIEILEKAFLAQVKQSSFAEKYKRVLTIPGVGAVLGRIAICELPEDIEQWTSRQLASYAAVAPRDDSSGKRNGPAKVGKQGNLNLKAGLFMPAMAVVRRNGWGRATYDRLRLKGLKHQQAVIPVMRKLLMKIAAVLKRGSAWESDPPKRA